MSQVQYVNIPQPRGILVQTNLSKKEQHYKGIIANLLVQKILTDAIQGMSSCQSCLSQELANMLADKVGTAAVVRRV
jgi:hypothetical protein